MLRRFPRDQTLFYARLDHVIFIHFALPPEQLRSFIPRKAQLDTFRGRAYLSIVALYCHHLTVAPFCIPVFGMQGYFQVNIRTYARYGDKRGVVFISSFVGSLLAGWFARYILGLNYFPAAIRLREVPDAEGYISGKVIYGHQLVLRYKAKVDLSTELSTDSRSLAHFLVERYHSFRDIGRRLRIMTIAHKPWPLYSAKILDIQAHYLKELGIGVLQNRPSPVLVHYSPGVQSEIKYACSV